MKNRPPFLSRVFTPTLIVLVVLNLGLLFLIGWPFLTRGELPGLPFGPAPAASQRSPENSPSPAPSSAPGTPTPPPAYIPIASDAEGVRQHGLLLFSMSDGEYQHLFVYHPLYFPLTRLSAPEWDEADPALSPDGTRLAYRSRRNGYWNLYILDLTTGSLTQITDTPAYDGAPTWSPDSQWLAYESYVDDNLEILVQSVVDLAQAPIRLTEDPGLDAHPVWSPQGREIAFVSSRSGEEEIWLARLDQTDNRFHNLSQDSAARNESPAWSADGKYLSFASEREGASTLYLWNSQQPELRPWPVGPGNRPVWSPNGDVLATELRSPNKTGIQGYNLADRSLIFPIYQLPGYLEGLEWKKGPLVDWVLGQTFPPEARQLAAPLWNPALSVNPMPPNGRFGIVPVPDITAPYAYLHDAVDESYNQLRALVARKAGWDFLANLENAYYPLTEPLSPNMNEDWLMTGRGVALNSLPLTAGWMVIVREDYNGQTYWRLYIKARYQDGSQGLPLTQTPWDITARYTGDTRSYEAGGRPARPPAGYWVDFTELAARTAWERQSSLNDWRTYLPSTRFNLYVLTGGLDWHTAMSEVYPPEALVTVTYRPTFTRTVTLTPKNFELWTLTPSYTPTLTPTLHPTWTPSP